MPYSLTLKPPERTKAVWEGEEGSDPSNTPQHQYSISSPGELDHHPTNLPRADSLSEDEVQQEVSTAKVNVTPSIPSSRVARLVRDRQLRRSNCYTFGDEVEGKEGLGGNGGMGGGAGDRRGAAEAGASQGGVRMDSYESSGSLNDKGQRATQRLLVVANRLPVSAIRDGESWDLKLSAGGLVSALLGMVPALCRN